MNKIKFILKLVFHRCLITEIDANQEFTKHYQVSFNFEDIPN